MDLRSGKSVIILATILYVLFISGCKYIPYVDKYNLFTEEIIAIDSLCDNFKVSKNGLEPEILYARMNSCIYSNEYNKATKLYLLAGSYTYYDYNRVKTQYAKNQHTRLLSNSLLTLTDIQKNTFWDEVKKVMNHEKENNCNEIFNIGPPIYEPNYMYLDEKNKIIYPFNENNWKKSVNEYLGCSFENQ